MLGKGYQYLVAWQSSIDRLNQIRFPSYEVWFEEKEISHGQISRYPHGGGTLFAAENGVVGKGAARTLLHGRILLQADVSPEGMQYPDDAIAEALSVSLSTIHRVRQQFVEESFETALHPRRPLKRPDKVTITGEVEQQLIALACGEPPRGHGRWTVRLLADRLVELGYVARASRETVRQALKKTISSCGR